MEKILKTENIGLAIGILAGATTLAIAPGYSYDAFTAIKLIFVSALGAISIFYTLQNVKTLGIQIGKLVTILIFVMLLNMMLIFFMSEINITQSFYGVSGRYTGLLTYLSLVFTLVAAALSSTASVRRKILNILIFCGLISVIYALIQYSGNDFVNWDTTAGSQVIGFLGNPNFVASFLALSATAVFAKILDPKSTIQIKIFYVAVVIGTLIALVGANATQGFLIIVLGFAIVLYFYSRFRFKSPLPSRIILITSSFGITVGILDIFQKVPWDPFLYGETISFRGDFWRAGWNMALSNPIFGVGFDGYLNHFRRSRDLVASNRLGADIPTDASHNVLLDYASNGGIFFALLNVLLIIFVLNSARNYLKKVEKFDSNFIAIFAIWIGFTIQSVISINQLGLAIWGWVFGGLILGAKYAATDFDQRISKKTTSKQKKSGVDIFVGMLAVYGLLGGMIALPIVLADHKFKLAIDSKNALNLYNSANSWPPITKKMILVTAVLDQNKIYKEAKILSERTIAINPDSFEAWIIYAHNPLLSEVEIAEVKRQLVRLDPNIDKLGGVDKYLAEKLAESQKIVQPSG